MTKEQIEKELNVLENERQNTSNALDREILTKEIIKLEKKLKKLTEKAENPPKEKDLRYRIWCKVYKNATKLSYMKDIAGIKNLKGCELSDEEFEAMAKVFMSSNEWWSNPKTLKNFLTRLNELNMKMNGADQKPKSKWPDEFNQKLAERLTREDLEDYHAHLRSIGLIPHKIITTGGGTKVKWLKKTSV